MYSIYSANADHLNVELPSQDQDTGIHLWLAGSLISFTLIYIALSTWLNWYALHLLFGLSAEQTSLFTLVAGACSGFLGMFMARTVVRLPLYIFRSYLSAR